MSPMRATRNRLTLSNPIQREGGRWPLQPVRTRFCMKFHHPQMFVLEVLAPAIGLSKA